MTVAHLIEHSLLVLGLGHCLVQCLLLWDWCLLRHCSVSVFCLKGVGSFTFTKQSCSHHIDSSFS
jgi:hypothetical protein